MRMLFIAITLWFHLTFPITAMVLENEPSELKLGISEFRMKTEYRVPDQIGATISELFLERIRGIEKKRISPKEQAGFIRGLIERKWLEELNKKDELVRRRDLLALSPLTRKDRTTYIELTRQIMDSRERLRILTTIDPSTVTLNQEVKPIQMVDTNLRGELLPPPRSTFLDLSRTYALDYLIAGEVEEVFLDVFSIKVILYDAISHTILFEGRTMGASDEFELLVDNLMQELATVLIGDDWGSLEIHAIPNDAGIFLNGRLLGIGRTKKPYLPHGEYLVEIHRPGYRLASERIHIQGQEEKTLTIQLEMLPLIPLQVYSIPDQAVLYLGAMAKGTTPFTLGTPLGGEVGKIKKEGYRSIVFPMESGISEVRAILPKEIFPWEDLVERKRESFYASFGWFILSLPLPILLYGYYENEALRYIQYTGRGGFSRDRARDLSNRLDSLYFGYLGSIFLTSSFLVNAIVHLLDYLQTAEASVRYP